MNLPYGTYGAYGDPVSDFMAASVEKGVEAKKKEKQKNGMHVFDTIAGTGSDLIGFFSAKEQRKAAEAQALASQHGMSTGTTVAVVAAIVVLGGGTLYLIGKAI